MSTLTTLNIQAPIKCPHCHELLKVVSVDLCCTNAACNGNAIKQLNTFLRNCGVQGFSEKMLDKWGLDSIEKVLAFYPQTNNEKKFLNELYGKIFNKTKVDLIINLPFHNFGSTLVRRVMEAYGKNRLAYNNINVDGISNARQEDFKAQFVDLVKWVEAITHDNRWKPQAAKRVINTPISNKLNGLSFCFTGKLETMARSEAEKYVKSNGGEVKSVSNKLTYLVTNNPNSGTSKNRKAQNLGVKLITEAEFAELLGKKIDLKKDSQVQKDQVFDINDL